jgi:glycosyltransferase involved in cell wall biosynthesis
MGKNTAISVIIPVYNADKYLTRCLSSVQQQSMKDLEILCINDGSTDESLHLLEKFAEKDGRFKIISQPNKGLSASRNVGLEKATGDYVFFLDADDWLHPQALEIFYNAAQKSGAPVVVGETFCRLGKEKPDLRVYQLQKMKFSLRSSPLHDLYKKRHVSAVAWNKLYRADIVRNRRFIDGIFFEDWPFTTCLFADIDFFVSISQPLYMYNTTDCSITRSNFSIKKIRDYMIGIRYVAEYFNTPERRKKWRLVQRKRIAASVKMMLSKISKSQGNMSQLETYFKEEFIPLWQQKIIRLNDLPLKSKFRLCRLWWHQRKK